MEVNNLAIDRKNYTDLILAMNNKLNFLIKHEVGEDVGQMLPSDTGADWKLSPDLKAPANVAVNQYRGAGLHIPFYCKGWRKSPRSPPKRFERELSTIVLYQLSRNEGL